MNNPNIYEIDPERSKYPSCFYASPHHEEHGIVSPGLLQCIDIGKLSWEEHEQYTQAEIERLKQKVNSRTCTRNEWKWLNRQMRRSPVIAKLLYQLNEITSSIIDGIYQSFPALFGDDSIDTSTQDTDADEIDYYRQCLLEPFCEQTLPQKPTLWQRIKQDFRTLADWMLGTTEGEDINA